MSDENEMVAITWLDSGLSYTDGWKDMDFISKTIKLASVTTVGIKFFEDETSIYIALSVHENDAYGVQLIAKSNVLSYATLAKQKFPSAEKNVMGY